VTPEGSTHVDTAFTGTTSSFARTAGRKVAAAAAARQQVLLTDIGCNPAVAGEGDFPREPVAWPPAGRRLCSGIVAAVLDWSHNTYYHRLLLRHLPRRCQRVLDVGCGDGTFAARLAEHSAQVDAVDRSAPMIEQARRRAPDNVDCIVADVLTDPLPAKDYDAILSICALHHMPLQDALPVFAAALRPGGVLAVVALPRMDLRHEWPVELVAAVAHRLLGVVFLANGLLRGSRPFAKEHHTRTGMPVVMNPPLTTRAVASQAAAVLSGARVRRLLFWRYLLIWEKPILHDGSPATPPPSTTTK